ncbi:LysR family transcriptional regulator [Uliginosibacterium sp. H3]|uniref:LysR family transcriptional regulator n=1 Tax=Uliginosibacterium silvisoli TaxID=3114758 RepID=A0ABU6K2N1_9RHOO|nr:LysR family transcriptional regulator [Uliginosibacterium sp. H3]
MDRLDTFRLFVRLMELGSFAAAAAELGVSPSAASKAINQLEASLGARLLHRTTRRLSLTEAGTTYLERARAVLLAVEEADAEAAGATVSASGRLRLNMPMALGLADLGEALADFAAEHPGIELDVDLGDRHADLLAEGFDLGLRATTDPKDSSYVAQRIAAFPLHICAAPAYMERHGRPATPDDLAEHACFAYVYATAGLRWPLRWRGQTHVVITPRMRANNTLFLKRLVLAGLGIAVLPGFVAKPEIDTGALVELFPDVERPPLLLFAQYPERRLTPHKVSVCVAFLKDWFAARQA